ncbi:MAG: preprotein translocase subunit YajC [Cyclobacteriaceae bacterium]
MHTILLQAPTEGFPVQFLFIGGIILVFYFFMIRPQQKKQKDQKKFIGEISKGNMIVTVGGIHGKVVSVDDHTATIEVDRGSKIKIEKSSISLEASKQYAKDSK